MDHIARRFRYLYTGEATAAILFIGLSALVDYTYESLTLYTSSAFWSAFLLLELLLAQGTYYWYVKYNSYIARKRISLSRIRTFKRWQRINGVLFVVVGIICMIELWHVSTATLLVIVGIYVFALLEYINYFYVQLSYDNAADLRYLWQHKKLKVASLQRDFQRLKG
ncbi:hypothetical protein [Caryophanon latum]|uniref:General stress protein n=1 Tax=Caryophanon latum TaxID=33977 RepID=A0A1C0YT11_9BACL|nr:hypothetical protein [Caryophanon latum]OCS90291.1 hypothetical protein A6K76_11835 [Caryophanon latum]